MRSPPIRSVVTAVYHGKGAHLEITDDSDIGRCQDGFRRAAATSKRMYVPVDAAVGRNPLTGWQPRALDLETAMRTYSFGVSANYMASEACVSKPDTEQGNVWHSTQRCVEMLVRP